MSSMKQGSLDDVVTRQQRPPTFTTDGLLDYLVELVVCEDEVQYDWPFIDLDLIKFNRPSNSLTKGPLDASLFTCARPCLRKIYLTTPSFERRS